MIGEGYQYLTDNSLPRQYSNPKANLTTTSPNEDMVEEYLHQALGLEDEDAEEMFTTANCVQKVEVPVTD